MASLRRVARLGCDGIAGASVDGAVASAGFVGEAAGDGTGDSAGVIGRAAGHRCSCTGEGIAIASHQSAIALKIVLVIATAAST